MTKTKQNILSLLAVAVFAVLAAGSFDTDSDTKNVQSQAPAYTLGADSLYRDYKANEVAADNKYKGKVVVVSGIVRDIGKDITDDAYIVIGGAGFLDGVQCTFTKGEHSSIAALSRGQSVTVKGQVIGKMGNVQLNKCTLQ